MAHELHSLVAAVCLLCLKYYLLLGIGIRLLMVPERIFKHSEWVLLAATHPQIVM